MSKYLENNKNNKTVDTLRINRENMLSYLDSELKKILFYKFLKICWTELKFSFCIFG